MIMKRIILCLLCLVIAVIWLISAWHEILLLALFVWGTFKIKFQGEHHA